MGETDYPATEQAAAHPGSSPRTLKRYGARVDGPPCVSCCNRAHGLRSRLDDRIAEEERPVHVDSEGDYRRDGRKIATGEKNICVANCLKELS